MVDFRKLRASVKKARLPVLVELHRELAIQPPDEVYQQTVAEMDFDPQEVKTQEMLDMVHGPTWGPYQEKLDQNN